jgi:hypothetical protein
MLTLRLPAKPNDFPNTLLHSSQMGLSGADALELNTRNAMSASLYFLPLGSRVLSLVVRHTCTLHSVNRTRPSWYPWHHVNMDLRRPGRPHALRCPPCTIRLWPCGAEGTRRGQWQRVAVTLHIAAPPRDDVPNYALFDTYEPLQKACM